MKKLTVIIATLTASLSIYGQELNSAYFMDGYKYSHRLNPAFAPTRSYFSLPAIGGVSISTRSNLGQGNFFFPYENGLTTFMSSNVSSEEFLSGLKETNYLGADMSLNLFSIGVWGKKGFTSAELTIKAGMSATLPYEFFNFVKDPGTQGYYDIQDFNLGATGYAELSIGHAHAINDNISVGGKLKFLTGIANVDLQLQSVQVTTGEEAWSLKSSGAYYYTVPETSEGVSSVVSSLNYGFAVDLGVEYKFDGLLKGLNLSFAVSDLGFINWKNNTLYAANNVDIWEFAGFDEISFDDESENDIGTQFNALIDELGELELFQDAVSSKKSSFLDFCLRLGAEYELPLPLDLSVGFLYTCNPGSFYTLHEGRFFLNLNPLKFINLSVNYAASNLGSSVGGIINFDLPGFGLFIGSDSIVWRYRSISNIPIPYGKLNFNLNFGITFNIGPRRTLN